MGQPFLKQKEMEVRKNMGEFRYEKVKDPEYFMDHRMDAHSDHVAVTVIPWMGSGNSITRKTMNRR